MIYTGAEYSLENIYHQLLQQARYEDIRTYEQYKELVDLFIEEKKSYGFFSEDEDLVQIKHSLELRWREVGANLAAKR